MRPARFRWELPASHIARAHWSWQTGFECRHLPAGLFARSVRLDRYAGSLINPTGSPTDRQCEYAIAASPDRAGVRETSHLSAQSNGPFGLDGFLPLPTIPCPYKRWSLNRDTWVLDKSLPGVDFPKSVPVNANPAADNRILAQPCVPKPSVPKLDQRQPRSLFLPSDFQSTRQ